MSASLIVLIVMASAVLMIAVYRKLVARNEDDFVHLSDGNSQLIANQHKTEHSLTLIDRAGKTLTAVTIFYGIAWVVYYLYTGLMQPSL